MRLESLAVILAFTSSATASEPTPLDRARANLAFAAATLEGPHVHPDPEATGYAAGYARAMRGDLPLFVYVGQPSRPSSYAIVCTSAVFNDANQGSVVVAVPLRGELIRAGTFDGCPSEEKLVTFTRDFIRRRKTVEMSPPQGNLIMSNCVSRRG